MLRVVPLILLAGALACEAAQPPASKSDANKPGAAGKPDAASKPDASKPETRPAVIVEAEGPTPADDRSPPPPWYDEAKIPHVKVVNRIASRGKIAGGDANAIILELAPGTSDEQCIELARKVIGETLPEVPEAGPPEDGRLMLKGQTDAYHYTAVCGEVEGKPTMYLSYTTKPN